MQCASVDARTAGPRRGALDDRRTILVCPDRELTTEPTEMLSIRW